MLSSRPLIPLVILLVAGCSPQSGDQNTDPNPAVWVMVPIGKYVCKGDANYESSVGGQLALESVARAKGYKSTSGRPCGDGTVLANPDSASLALGRIPLQPSPVPQVWVNTRSRIYHCEGSQFFQATEHGKLMSQGAAKAAGYSAAGSQDCE